METYRVEIWCGRLNQWIVTTKHKSPMAAISSIAKGVPMLHTDKRVTTKDGVQVAYFASAERIANDRKEAGK